MCVLLAGCGYLGPAVDIAVTIELTAREVVGEIDESDAWEYEVTVAVHDNEYSLVVGDPVTLSCTTRDWITFHVRSIKTSSVIDRTVSRRSSIQGHDVLDLAPYSIERVLTAGGEAADGGPLEWRFVFDLDARETPES